MTPLSLAMFVAVGLAVGHIAHKASEGGIPRTVALGLGLAGALAGGLGAAAAGMAFYDMLGHMVVAAGCGTLCVLIWRQLRA